MLRIGIKAPNAYVAQVDPEIPGEFTIRECADTVRDLLAVQPTHTHFRGKLASVCWVDDLFVTNRARLYKEVLNAVFKQVMPQQSSQPVIPESVPFKLVSVAGDGRCGWRSLLCAFEPEEFQRIPRIATLLLIHAFG